MKIVFDIDGVIANYDFNHILSKYLHINGIYNEDIHCYDSGECLGLSVNDAKYLYTEAAKEPLNIVPGAIETLKKLIENNTIIIWTSRFNFLKESEIKIQLKRAVFHIIFSLKH